MPFETVPYSVVLQQDEAASSNGPASLRSMAMSASGTYVAKCVEKWSQQRQDEAGRSLVANVPHSLVDELVDTVRAAVDSKNVDNVFSAWRMFYIARNNKKLILSEFLGHRWSQLAFDYIAQKGSTAGISTPEVVLCSQALDQKTLDFLFVSESHVWMPKFPRFLVAFKGLTELSLGAFVDDRCLSEVALNCPKLVTLRLSSLDYFDEDHLLNDDHNSLTDGLTDDGFHKFVKIVQEKREMRLKKLHLGPFRTNGVTTMCLRLVTIKSLLGIRSLPHLEELRVTSPFFRGASVTVPKEADVLAKQTSSVRVLHLDVWSMDDNCAAESLVNFSALFPSVQEAHLSRLSFQDAKVIEACRNIMMADRVRTLSVCDSSDVGFIAEHFPNLQSLTLFYRAGGPEDSASSPGKFEHLRKLSISAHSLLVSHLRPLLDRVVRLYQLSIWAPGGQFAANDDGLLDDGSVRELLLMERESALRDLEVFSVAARTKLSWRTVDLLLRSCPRIKRIEQLQLWSGVRESGEVARQRQTDTGKKFRVLFASRSDSNKPWQLEDGTTLYGY